MSIEDQIRQALERHGEDVTPLADPLGSALRRLARARRVRAVGVALGAAAVIALLVVGVPLARKQQAVEPIAPHPSPSVTAVVATGTVSGAHLGSNGEGWVIVDGTLLRTLDGGETWTVTFTPRRAKQHVLDADLVGGKAWIVHTLSTLNAPLRIAVAVAPSTCHPCSETTSVVLELPAPPNGAYGGASIDMLDPSTGWILVDIGGSTAVSNGALFRTLDGARWTRMPDPPAAGRLVFADASNGWISGGPGGGRLYHTGDGGKTWEEVTISGSRRPVGARVDLSAPPGCDGASIGTPAMLTRSEFATPVSYHCAKDRVVTRIYPMDLRGTIGGGPFEIGGLTGPNDVTFAAANASTWFATQGDGELAVTRDGGSTWSVSNPLGFPRTPVIFTFGDALHGWAVSNESACTSKSGPCLSIGGLFATSDGGKTWTQLQPR